MSIISTPKGKSFNNQIVIIKAVGVKTIRLPRTIAVHKRRLRAYRIKCRKTHSCQQRPPPNTTQTKELPILLLKAVRSGAGQLFDLNQSL